MLNESVIKVLKNNMWDLATCINNEPNVVPVAFKDVTSEGKLIIGDVFLETTLNNLKENNGKIAISVYDGQNLEGYQIKGTAEYVIEGEVVNTFKAMVEKMFNDAATAKGALIVTPSKVIVTTPGKDNKKEMNTSEYVYTNSLDGEKYKKDKKYREKVDYLLSRDNINGSKKLMGYLGEITRDNRVIDDENNFVAIKNYEEKGKEAQKILNSLNEKYKSD